MVRMDVVQRGVLEGVHLIQRAGACDDRLVAALDDAQPTNQAVHVSSDLLQLKEEIVSMSESDARHSGAGVVVMRTYAFADEGLELFMQSIVGFDRSFGVEIEAGVQLGLTGRQ